MPEPMQPPELSEKDQARFWSKVALPNREGCMLWTAGCTPAGYGELNVNGRMAYAHRLSYVLAYGPIPEGMVLDHVRTRGCKSRRCVAPLHLEAVTPGENTLRGLPRVSGTQKTQCLRGHPFDEVNTYVRPGGGRDCQTCKAERNQRSRERRRAG